MDVYKLPKDYNHVLVLFDSLSDLPLFIISNYRLCNFMTYVVVYNYSLYLFTF